MLRKNLTLTYYIYLYMFYLFDIKTINFKLTLVYNTFCGSIGVGHYFVNYALSPACNSSERNVKTTVHASNENELIMIKNKESEMKQMPFIKKLL